MGSSNTKFDHQQGPKYSPLKSTINVTENYLIDGNVQMLLNDVRTGTYNPEERNLPIGMVNMTFEHCLYDSVSSNYLKMVVFLIENNLVQLSNYGKKHCINLAVRNASADILKYFCQLGYVQLSLTTNEPMNVAMVFGNFECAIFLTGLGYDPFEEKSHSFSFQKLKILYECGYWTKSKKDRHKLHGPLPPTQIELTQYQIVPEIIFRRVIMHAEQTTILTNMFSKHAPLKFILKPTSVHMQLSSL
jgi:hypothetical protein